jgi:hypothetical protein
MDTEPDPIVEILRQAYRRGLQILRARQNQDPSPPNDKVESKGETDEHTTSNDNPTNAPDRPGRD